MPAGGEKHAGWTTEPGRGRFEVAIVGREEDNSESGREASSRIKGPNARQEEILAAYAQTPNAAAVGRALRTNEGHVRRLVKQFPDRLDELRRERDRE
jgi:hypothetical protein